MSVLTIVDTDILIDVARNTADATMCLADIEEHSIPAVSVITQMELLDRLPQQGGATPHGTVSGAVPGAQVDRAGI